MMALNLSTNWDSELVRKWLIERLGEEKAAELQIGAADDWPWLSWKEQKYWMNSWAPIWMVGDGVRSTN